MKIIEHKSTNKRANQTSGMYSGCTTFEGIPVALHDPPNFAPRHRPTWHGQVKKAVVGLSGKWLGGVSLGSIIYIYYIYIYIYIVVYTPINPISLTCTISEIKSGLMLMLIALNTFAGCLNH